MRILIRAVRNALAGDNLVIIVASCLRVTKDKAVYILNAIRFFHFFGKK